MTTTSKNIQIKRIYEAPDSSDGYRVLVDRLWPRGIKKEDAKLDEWTKDLAPSSELRKWFDHKEERFDEFSKRYKKELESKSEELIRLNKIAKTGKMSLLYGAKNQEINQAVVLLKVLNHYANKKL